MLPQYATYNQPPDVSTPSTSKAIKASQQLDQLLVDFVIDEAIRFPTRIVILLGFRDRHLFERSCECRGLAGRFQPEMGEGRWNHFPFRVETTTLISGSRSLDVEGITSNDIFYLTFEKSDDNIGPRSIRICTKRMWTNQRTTIPRYGELKGINNGEIFPVDGKSSKSLYPSRSTCSWSRSTPQRDRPATRHFDRRNHGTPVGFNTPTLYAPGSLMRS